LRSARLVSERADAPEGPDTSTSAPIDELGRGALDVDEQAAARAGAQAELGGKHAVERGWADGGVGEVEHAVGGARELGAEVAQRAGLCDDRNR